jgi:hypothetical protein
MQREEDLPFFPVTPQMNKPARRRPDPQSPTHADHEPCLAHHIVVRDSLQMRAVRVAACIEVAAIPCAE